MENDIQKYAECLTYNPKEAAAVMGVTYQTVYDLCKSEESSFPCLKLNRRYLIPKNSLIKWLEEKAESGEPI